MLTLCVHQTFVIIKYSELTVQQSRRNSDRDKQSHNATHSTTNTQAQPWGEAKAKQGHCAR